MPGQALHPYRWQGSAAVRSDEDRPERQVGAVGRAYSRDASILAVGLQRAGDELPTQFFINSKTGEQVYAPLPQVWGVSWTKDNAVAYVQPRTRSR